MNRPNTFKCRSFYKKHPPEQTGTGAFINLKH